MYEAQRGVQVSIHLHRIDSCRAWPYQCLWIDIKTLQTPSHLSDVLPALCMAHKFLSELSPAKREPDLCDDIGQVGGLRFPTLPTSGFLAVKSVPPPTARVFAVSTDCKFHVPWNLHQTAEINIKIEKTRIFHVERLTSWYCRWEDLIRAESDRDVRLGNWLWQISDPYEIVWFECKCS